MPRGCARSCDGLAGPVKGGIILIRLSVSIVPRPIRRGGISSHCDRLGHRATSARCRYLNAMLGQYIQGGSMMCPLPIRSDIVLCRM